MTPTVVRVTSAEGFAAIAASWDALVAATEGATAFQSHAFLAAWWRHFADDRPPLVLCAWQSERLVGALALQRVEKHFLGRRLGLLQFLGMPDDVLRPVVLVPAGRTAAADALLAALAARPDWQVMQLDEVPAAAGFLGPLAAWTKRTGRRLRTDAFHGCPYLAKSGGWQDFLRARPRRFASRLRQAGNRLQRVGRVRHVTMSGPADADVSIARFRAVEARSWKHGTPAAVGHDARYAGFYRELLSGPGSGIRGHAMALLVDDEPVAATLGFSRGGVYHSLQIAHDRAWDRYSPGMLLEAQEMEWFFGNEALSRYEFLGSESFSKRRWTDRAVATVQLTIRSPGLLPSLYVGARQTVAPALAAVGRAFGDRAAKIEPFRLD